MVDITYKGNSLRVAIAQALVTVSQEKTISAITGHNVPKGDVFEMSKASGLLAAKNTAYMIPGCHPLPIESTKISHEINGLEIKVMVEIKAIYKTGVEVEAMHAASVVALTIYDMLKPIDEGIEIANIRLIKERNSNYHETFAEPVKAAVIVCSDSVLSGKKKDSAGKAIVSKLKNLPVVLKDYKIISDEARCIRVEVKKHIDNGIELVLLTGGTSLEKNNCTNEAIKPLLDLEIPGIGEHLRHYGQNRMPYSILSKSIGGLIGNALVIALPGSTKGALESMDALFPHTLHVFKMINSGKR